MDVSSLFGQVVNMTLAGLLRQNFLPKFNSEFTPEKFPKPNRKVAFQPSVFRGKLAVNTLGDPFDRRTGGQKLQWICPDPFFTIKKRFKRCGYTAVI